MRLGLLEGWLTILRGSEKTSQVSEVVTLSPYADCCSWQLLQNEEVELKTCPRRLAKESRDHPCLGVDLAFFLGLSGRLEHLDGGLWKEESNELIFSSLYLTMFPPGSSQWVLSVML